MKKLLLLSFFAIFACSSDDKNSLIIPPNYSELPEINSESNSGANSDGAKLKENIGNQESVDKLKEILQKND